MSAPSIPLIRNRPKAIDQSLKFFWNPPASGTVLGYTLTDGTNTYSPSSSPYTVSTLTNGQLYSFSLTASNASGNSPTAYFTPVRPGFYPEAPTGVSGTVNGAWATVSWTNPINTGGTELLGTVLTAIPFSNGELIQDKNQYIRKCVVPESLTTANIYLSSLTSNVQYKVLVQSVNDPGYSPRTSYTNTLGNNIVTGGRLIYLDATTYSGSETWFDSGSNGFDATVENGTPSLNASSNGIVLNGSTNFQFDNLGFLSTFTASLWYKNTGPAVGESCILTEKYTGGNINIVFPKGNTASNFSGGFFNGQFRLGSVCNYSDSLWHNHVVTWDGTTLITYFDNLAVGSNIPGSSPEISANQYRIGRRWDLADYVTGQIGQVSIYNRALTSAEVGSNYVATSNIYA